MSALSGTVDAVLEATVVGSFSRFGYGVRSRLGHWPARDAGADLGGRTVLVTGATSGIGLAAALRLATLGASVRMLARNEERAEQARNRIVDEVGPDIDVGFDQADVSDLDSLRAFATRFSAANPRLHALVHNAGALNREFRLAPGGTEATLAAHVLGPFLLSGLLLPVLRRGGPGRVITVSSGGMYTQRFDLGALEMDPAHYDGTVAYARAKRAQVVLNGAWARRLPADEVVFHAMHPGWVDTPGMEVGLPTFQRVMKPVLRTPAQGADTAVWLASDDEALASTGRFWHDRRRRGEHRLPWTRGDDDDTGLWALCEALTGWDGPEVLRGAVRRRPPGHRRPPFHPAPN